MPFGVVSGVGLGMGVLDLGDDRRRGRGSFGGEFWSSYCNQWGLFDALFSNYFEDLFILHCVSKNDTDVTHYRFNTYQPISVIFGRDVAERVCYRMVIYYPTSPN